MNIKNEKNNEGELFNKSQNIFIYISDSIFPSGLHCCFVAVYRIWRRENHIYYSLYFCAKSMHFNSNNQYFSQKFVASFQKDLKQIFSHGLCRISWCCAVVSYIWSFLQKKRPQNLWKMQCWPALATAPAETSAEAKEAFNFNNSSSSFFSFFFY